MPMVAAAVASAVTWVSSAAAAAVTLTATGLGAIGAVSALGMGGTYALAAGILKVSALALGSYALNAVMAPKVGSAGSPVQFKADPSSPIRGVMGRFGTGGTQAHFRVWGKNNLMISYMVILSLGPIQGVANFTANNLAVNFTGHNGEAAKVEPYRDKMWMTYKTGLPTDGSLAPPPTGGSPAMEWYSYHRTSGYAGAMWTMQNNSKRASYEGGVPKPLWEVLGQKLYDPRKDSTQTSVGGSGSHRIDDWQTWEFTENPIIHALNWALGHHKKLEGGTIDRSKLLAGVGAPLSHIDLPTFVAGANVADINNWKISGEWNTQDGKWQTLVGMLQAGSSVPVHVGAKIGIMTNAPRTHVAVIQGSDILGNTNIKVMASSRARFNTVYPRYINKNQNWEYGTAGAVTSAVYVDQDRGVERPKEITYNYVSDPKQAAELAAYDLANTRETLKVAFASKPHHLGIKPGDAVLVNSPERGLLNHKFIVVARPIDVMEGGISFDLRSETDSKHAWALGQAANPEPSPGLAPINPQPQPPEDDAWVVTPRPPDGGGSQQPGFVIEGEVPDGIGEILFESGPSRDGPWKQFYKGPPTTERVPIDGLEPGAEYYVRVTYYSVQGYPSEPKIYGPQTVPAYVSEDTQNVAGYPASDLLVDLQSVEALAAETAAAVQDLVDVYGDTVSAAESAAAAAASEAAAIQAKADALIAAADAADSASASSTAKQAAETARAQAQTARDESVASATNAAGSAATASSAAGQSVTAKDQAQGFATAANTSAQNAAGSATAAGNSASAANSAKVAAEAARDTADSKATAAAASAASAAASATTAGEKASAAQTSATAADTSRGQAQTAASQASQSETNAAGSAASASSAAQNAATSRDQASGFATAASGSASTASTKATEAGNSAAAALASQVSASTAAGSAQSVANQLMPDRVSDASNFTNAWTLVAPEYTTPLAEGVNVATSDQGVVRQFTGSIPIASRGWRKVEAGRVYRFTSISRVVSGAPGNQVRNGFGIFDANSELVAWWLEFPVRPNPAGWVTDRRDLSGNWVLSTYPNAAYIRPVIHSGIAENSDLPSVVWEVSALRCEDVTESVAANIAATAAATSASSASASETAAGQFASAASGSATNAATSAGQALTYRNQASTSAADAQAASVSAGVSASTAQLTSAKAMPDRPSEAGDFAAEGDPGVIRTPEQTSPMTRGTTVATGDQGLVRQFSDATPSHATAVMSRGWKKIERGRSYRFTTTVRVITGAPSNSFRQGIYLYKTDGAPAGWWFDAAPAPTHDPGWVTFSRTVTGDQLLNDWPEAVYARPWVQSSINGSNSAPIVGVVWQVSTLRLEDVTESASAANSAAVAQSASASASASAASAQISANLAVSVANANPNIVSNSTALAGMQGWESFGNSLIQAEPRFVDGARFISYIPGAGNYNPIARADFVEFPSGRQISVSGEVYANGMTNNGAIRVYVEFYSATGSLAHWVVAFHTGNTNGEWVKIKTEGIVAPPGTTRVRCHIDTYEATWGVVAPVAAWRNIKVENSATATPWNDIATTSALSAQLQITASTTADLATRMAEARFEVTAAAGGNVAQLKIRADTSGSLAALVAGAISFANTVGDTVVEAMKLVGGEVFFMRPIYIDAGNRRLIVGPGGQWVLWFGPDTINAASATRTNGYFALGTDGQVYLGAAALREGGNRRSLVNVSERSVGSSWVNMADYSMSDVMGGADGVAVSATFSVTQFLFVPSGPGVTDYYGEYQLREMAHDGSGSAVLATKPFSSVTGDPTSTLIARGARTGAVRYQLWARSTLVGESASIAGVVDFQVAPNR